MNRQTLADRLVTYSDTVVAFALVNGFAFLITLGEPDIRCSISAVSQIAFAMNILFPVVGTYALIWLRRYERRLRSGPDGAEEDEDGEPSAGVVTGDPLVDGFWNVMFRIRIALIWIFSVLVIVGIYGATLDANCSVSRTALP